MNRITADTFAEFNRACELDRAERAKTFLERATDLNNTVAQCAYWARRSKALTKLRGVRVVGTATGRVFLRNVQ